jgi:hypothetical protein
MSNLRVADGSIIPNITNTQAPCVIIGRSSRPCGSAQRHGNLLDQFPYVGPPHDQWLPGVEVFPFMFGWQTSQAGLRALKFTTTLEALWQPQELRLRQ